MSKNPPPPPDGSFRVPDVGYIELIKGGPSFPEMFPRLAKLWERITKRV